MIRKRISYPVFSDGEPACEKRERKESFKDNGDSRADILAKTSSDSVDRLTSESSARRGSEPETMEIDDCSRPNSRERCREESREQFPETSQTFAYAAAPLDLSNKKRRLTGSASLDENAFQTEQLMCNDPTKRKTCLPTVRGGSFGAGGTGLPPASSTIKWRRQLDVSSSLPMGQQIDDQTRRANSESPVSARQHRPTVIRSADLTFETPLSTDVDEHFRKSLGVLSSTEVDAEVDDHFARALGDVWWTLKNRIHLTPSNESSHSPSASPFSIAGPARSSPPSAGPANVVVNRPAKDTCKTTSFASTPLKKRLLTKAAIDAQIAVSISEAHNAAKISNEAVSF